MSSFEYNVTYGTDTRRLQIDNELTDEAIVEIEKSDFDLLWLRGNKNNFERLSEVDFSKATFKKLNFQSGKVQDISWVGKVRSLESITIKGKTKGNLNFEELKNLNSCDLDYSKGTAQIVESNIKLERLGLSRIEVPLSDFNKTLAKNLKVLGLSGHKLTSLNGLEGFFGLEKIGIYTNKNLKDISELKEVKTLKKIHFEGVNNVENLEVLGEILTLEELFFECKVFPSLKLLLPAPNLNYVRLGENTLIEDNDVEVALDFPKLEYMTFTKKKGYKYDAVQLKDAIQQMRTGV